MNIFTDIIFIFVFVFILCHFEIINITNTNIIKQKILLFIAVTLFASTMYIMKTIRKKTPIDIWNSFSNGLLIGLFAYIGHTLLFDLWYIPETNKWLIDIVDDKYITLNILLAIFVVISIAFSKSFGYIFVNETNCSQH